MLGLMRLNFLSVRFVAAAAVGADDAGLHGVAVGVVLAGAGDQATASANNRY